MSRLLCSGTGFNAFAGVLASGGQVKAIVAPGCAAYTRREIDELTELAKRGGAKGLATIALTAEGVRSPIAKFLSEAEDRRADDGDRSRRRRSRLDRRRSAGRRSEVALLPARRTWTSAQSRRSRRLCILLDLRVPAAGMGRGGQPLGRHPQPLLGLPGRRSSAARHRSRRRSRQAVRPRPQRE